MAETALVGKKFFHGFELVGHETVPTDNAACGLSFSATSPVKVNFNHAVNSFRMTNAMRFTRLFGSPQASDCNFGITTTKFFQQCETTGWNQRKIAVFGWHIDCA